MPGVWIRIQPPNTLELVLILMLYGILYFHSYVNQDFLFFFFKRPGPGQESDTMDLHQSKEELVQSIF